MAVLKQGILGGGSGKVANVVMTAWKGRNVLKSLPVSVSNPNTEGQQAQRNSFKGITQLGSLLLVGYVQQVCNVISGNITGYNFFVKQNKTAYNSAGVLVPANLRAGGGSLPTGVDSITGVPTLAKGILVDFNNTVAPSALRATDVCQWIGICPSTGDVFTSDGLTTRDDGTCNLLLQTPGSDLSGALHVFMFPVFKAANGRDVSIETAGVDVTVTFD